MNDPVTETIELRKKLARYSAQVGEEQVRAEVTALFSPFPGVSFGNLLHAPKEIAVMTGLSERVVRERLRDYLMALP